MKKSASLSVEVLWLVLVAVRRQRLLREAGTRPRGHAFRTVFKSCCTIISTKNFRLAHATRVRAARTQRRGRSEASVARMPHRTPSSIAVVRPVSANHRMLTRPTRV